MAFQLPSVRLRLIPLELRRSRPNAGIGIPPPDRRVKEIRQKERCLACRKRFLPQEAARLVSISLNPGAAPAPENIGACRSISGR